MQLETDVAFQRTFSTLEPFTLRLQHLPPSAFGSTFSPLEALTLRLQGEPLSAVCGTLSSLEAFALCLQGQPLLTLQGTFALPERLVVRLQLLPTLHLGIAKAQLSTLVLGGGLVAGALQVEIAALQRRFLLQLSGTERNVRLDLLGLDVGFVGSQVLRPCHPRQVGHGGQIQRPIPRIGFRLLLEHLGLKRRRCPCLLSSQIAVPSPTNRGRTQPASSQLLFQLGAFCAVLCREFSRAGGTGGIKRLSLRVVATGQLAQLLFQLLPQRHRLRATRVAASRGRSARTQRCAEGVQGVVVWQRRQCPRALHLIGHAGRHITPSARSNATRDASGCPTACTTACTTACPTSAYCHASVWHGHERRHRHWCRHGRWRRGTGRYGCRCWCCGGICVGRGGAAGSKVAPARIS